MEATKDIGLTTLVVSSTLGTTGTTVATSVVAGGVSTQLVPQ